MPSREVRGGRAGWHVHQSESDTETVYIASPSGEAIPEEEHPERYGSQARFRRASGTLMSYIQESPALALGISAAVGLAIAFGLRRWLDN